MSGTTEPGRGAARPAAAAHQTIPVTSTLTNFLINSEVRTRRRGGRVAAGRCRRGLRLALSLFVHSYLECVASLSRVWPRPFQDEGCRVRPVINARPAHSTVSLFSISLTPLTETRSVWLATLSRAVTLSHSLSIKYFPLLSMKFYTDG